MPLQEAIQFLDHERDNLLEPARREAEDNRGPRQPPSKQDFEHRMWNGWARYYAALLDQNRDMARWKEKKYEKYLGAELRALDILLGYVNLRINPDYAPQSQVSAGPTHAHPPLHPNAVACVENLRDLLQVEREATRQMLDEVVPHGP